MAKKSLGFNNGTFRTKTHANDQQIETMDYLFKSILRKKVGEALLRLEEWVSVKWVKQRGWEAGDGFHSACSDQFSPWFRPLPPAPWPCG